MKHYPPNKRPRSSSPPFQRAAVWAMTADSWQLSCSADSWPQNFRNSSASCPTSRKAASNRSCLIFCSQSLTGMSVENWLILSQKFPVIWWMMTAIIFGRSFSSFCSVWQARRQLSWRNRLCCSLGNFYCFIKEGSSSLHWLVSALKKLFFIQWSILVPSTAFYLWGHS